MATKKKSKKPAKTKRTSAKKAKSKKPAAKKKVAKKTAAKKTSTARRNKTQRKPTRKTRRRGSDVFEQRLPDSRSGALSGDLQGLSGVESADSESVDELVEEGNAFEADAIAGVEHADDDQEQEVHTHEVPEDDVPEEYLDEDR